MTLEIDEAVFAGQSALLLPAPIARLFARYAAVNAFVQTRDAAPAKRRGGAMAGHGRQPQPD